jgi:hypothetical protein
MSKQVLRHYGLTKAQSNNPNWLEIQRRFGIITSKDSKVNPNSNKSSLVWRDFVTELKNKIQNKYSRDTTLVRVPVELPYTMRFKNGTTRQQIKYGSIEYTRENRENMLNDARNKFIQGLEEDYDGSDDQRIITGFGNIIVVGDEIIIREGGSFRQRIGEAKIFMKESGMLNLGKDGVMIDRSWCRNKGTCVIDYLYYLLNDRPRIKKVIPKNIDDAYKRLDQLFKGFGNTDPFKNGITTEELEKFCELFDISLLAINKHKKIITHKKSKFNNHPAIVYIVSNNHFYPIEDKTERKSLFEKSKAELNSDKITAKKVKKKEKEVIFMTENIDVKKYTERIITERQTLPKKVRVSDNKITHLEYEDTTYLLFLEIPAVKEYCELNGIKYVGQNPVSILGELAVKSGDLLKNVKSVFNSFVEDILMTDGVKWRAHFGATEYINDDMIEWLEDNKDKWVGVDINKCYSHALLEPKDDWLVYGIEDNFEVFTESDYRTELPSGLYVVETYDFTLLHGSNIYSNKILDKAWKEDIKFKITHKLIHKRYSADEKKYPKNYFHPLLNLIKEKTQEKGMMKLLNNIISGYLGKTINTQYTAELDCDEEEVIREIYDTELNAGEEVEESVSRLFEDAYANIKYRDDIILQYLNISVVSPTHDGVSEDRKVLLYGFEKRTKQHEQSLPLYIQILDWANMMLYDMGKDVGGRVIFRHTDCIVSVGGKIPIDRMTKKWGDYSVEDKEFNWKSFMKTEERIVKFNIPVNEWVDDKRFTSSNQHKEIIEQVILNGGGLIQGRAGTGKTEVVKRELGIWVDDQCIGLKDCIKSMSFTNKASLNIHGTTIHKLLRLDSKYNIPAKTIEKLKDIEYFVVDEIGMIDNKLWNVLFILKKRIPSAIFILLGDYRQLPPVDNCRLLDWDIFNHPIVKYLCNNNRIELTERQRYDEALWNALEDGYERGDWSKIPRGSATIDDVIENKSVCYYNETRKKVNALCMEKNKDGAVFIPTRTLEELEEYKNILCKDFTKEEIKKIIQDEKIQDIYLYVGLPLMSYKNNTGLEIVNGEEFVVINYDNEKIYLQRLENRNNVGVEIEIDIDDLHKYFLVSYCITAHKSQGATYFTKVIIYDFERMIEKREVAYTALSRAKLLENIIVV